MNEKEELSNQLSDKELFEFFKSKNMAFIVKAFFDREHFYMEFKTTEEAKDWEELMYSVGWSSYGDPTRKKEECNWITEETENNLALQEPLNTYVKIPQFHYSYDEIERQSKPLITMQTLKHHLYNYIIKNNLK